MEKINIGNTLKQLRTSSKKSVGEIIAELEQYYGFTLAQSTLYGYENNHSNPNIDIFLALCMIYNCNDILYTFGYTDKQQNSVPPSQEDEQILKKYHSLTPSGRNLILGALGIEKDTPQQKIS